VEFKNNQMGPLPKVSSKLAEKGGNRQVGVFLILSWHFFLAVFDSALQE
jgi:hypothetical protein